MGPANAADCEKGSNRAKAAQRKAHRDPPRIVGRNAPALVQEQATGDSAKEGRKCGVFLALVSQRPAELDPTIISQCSTLFVMRMANDRDQDIVRSAVSDAAASLVALVPSLGNREVLAFGEGVALPARMIFGPLPADLVPSSDAVRNTHDGASPTEPRDLVEAIIARWRGASLAKQAFAEEAPPLAAAVDNGTFPLRPAATPSVSRSRILKENVVLGGEPAARP